MTSNYIEWVDSTTNGKECRAGFSISTERVFEAGDIVTLRSTGPPMIISKYMLEIHENFIVAESRVNVVCHWFHENEMMSAVFHQDLLELATNRN